MNRAVSRPATSISPATTSSPPPTLGVVAISYNEQENIRGFLDNLLPWVDEIVIVDDGSTDATASIATGYASRVRFIVSPRGDTGGFCDQRNKGIEASTAQWLLHMDIDERVSPQLASEILRRIGRESYRAYHFRRLNYFMNRPMAGGGWQRWNHAHLAERDVLEFVGSCHEEASLTCNEDETGQLDSKMYHLNEHRLRHRWVKSDLYLDSLAEDILALRPKITAWQVLALPLREFLKRYIFRLGVVDGVPGWISAVHSATAVFRACAMLWEQQHPSSRQQLEERIQQEWRESDQLPQGAKEESRNIAPR